MPGIRIEQISPEGPPDWMKGYAERSNGLMCEQCGTLVVAEHRAVTLHTTFHSHLEQMLAAAHTKD